MNWITNQLLAAGSAILVESTILVAWTIVAPFVYVRAVIYVDLFDNPIESTIAYVASKLNTIIYVGSLVSFHTVALGPDA